MSARIDLNALRSCLEGVTPSVLSTVARDGTPNISCVSQVHYVDSRHVALSFQFFNKTHENILSNPFAVAQVVDPDSGTHYRLSLRYLHTETEGALFENMKAKLSGIASHTGMNKVFHLRGADIYEVQSINDTQCQHLPCPPNRLAALRSTMQELGLAADLDNLFDTLLSCLHQHFDIHHSILLMHDKRGNRLYTVASQGYDTSGIGAEIPMGAGIIGVAAQQCTPIRITYMTGQYTYSLVVRKNMQASNPALELETEIPFAGLPNPHSQMAVPIARNGELTGILYVDSNKELRFTYEDEDALATLADYLALTINSLQTTAESEPESAGLMTAGINLNGPTCLIRRYSADNSIFIDDEYLIKGVAGAILWKLLRDFTTQQRSDFTNRELRLDPDIGLPEVDDNLEARLILLQKRLVERCNFLRINKTGRGRFQFQVGRPIALLEN